MIGSSRFEVGFCAGRICGLIAASFLLVTLLVKMAKMHSGAMDAAPPVSSGAPRAFIRMTVAKQDVECVRRCRTGAKTKRRGNDQSSNQE